MRFIGAIIFLIFIQTNGLRSLAQGELFPGSRWSVWAQGQFKSMVGSREIDSNNTVFGLKHTMPLWYQGYKTNPTLGYSVGVCYNLWHHSKWDGLIGISYSRRGSQFVNENAIGASEPGYFNLYRVTYAHHNIDVSALTKARMGQFEVALGLVFSPFRLNQGHYEYRLGSNQIWTKDQNLFSRKGAFLPMLLLNYARPDAKIPIGYFVSVHYGIQDKNVLYTGVGIRFIFPSIRKQTE